MELRFRVKGSQPEPYTVVFIREGDRLTGSCTCEGAASGQNCKHRLALLNGDISAVVSGAEAGAELKAMLAGSDVEHWLKELVSADQAIEAAKHHRHGVLKALARTLNAGSR